MKRILWITNRPIAGTCGTPKASSSGNWLDAAFDSLKSSGEFALSIVSTGNVNEIKHFEEGDHNYYILPNRGGKKYDVKNRKNISDWNKIKELVNPDVVQIWGTEHVASLLGARTFSDRPIVVYIQGVVAKIAKQYNYGLSLKDLYCNISLQDIFRGSWLTAAQRRAQRKVASEREILELSSAAIVENDWCEYQIKAINPNIRIFRSKLPIKDDFFARKWALDSMERQTIFTNAGSFYPIKGHQILFEAMKYVVAAFPDVKLYIPGTSRMGGGLNNKLRRKGFENLLRKIIVENHLENNIVYTGVLTSEQMAEHLSKCNVYVMPSCVENHSSSLIEAMVVGAPCVSSNVGGVSSVAEDGKNALLYNYPDAEVLGGLINKVLSDDMLAKELSDEALKIRPDRMVDLQSDFSFIYQNL